MSALHLPFRSCAQPDDHFNPTPTPPVLCSARVPRLRAGDLWVEVPGKASLMRHAQFGYTMNMNYQDYITIEPDKRGGKPCIRGLRITVYDILDYLASGMTEKEILEDFPDLTSEDIKACLAFAADRERKLFSVAA
jgi:uncharacterized protein (DUF433 family)